ncbi:chromosomal replication initiator protein DnaA [Chloroflexota bacterium]
MRARSAQELWEAALGDLQMQVSKANYRTWLENTAGLAYQDGHIIVGVPNAFVAEYLERNQRSLIEKTLACLTQCDTKVRFQVGTTQGSSTGNNNTQTESVAAPQASAPSFNPKYTFDSFIVGSCNRLAHAAAMGAAESPEHGFNPLFIYGGVGLGKTHLLQAIGHVALARNLQVLFASAERFTNEFVHAIRQRKTEDFQNKYRNVDMLLIDDIHFISGKEQTEESFFHTFNELHNANHQIVITCDCPPKSMSFLESRLRSRFEWGLIVAVEPPDWETRLAILQAKAEQAEVQTPPAVLEFIAQQSKENIRQLEGALNRVIAYSRLVGATPTLSLATKALQDIASKTLKPDSVTPSQVIEAVASSFELTPADLRSRKRDRETALGRQVAMYLIRQKNNCSLDQIGKELGGRDHSTVIHACEKIAISLETSSYLKRKMSDIQQAIGSR